MALTWAVAPARIHHPTILATTSDGLSTDNVARRIHHRHRTTARLPLYHRQHTRPTRKQLRTPCTVAIVGTQNPAHDFAIATFMPTSLDKAKSETGHWSPTPHLIEIHIDHLAHGGDGTPSLPSEALSSEPCCPDHDILPFRVQKESRELTCVSQFTSLPTAPSKRLPGLCNRILKPSSRVTIRTWKID